MGSVAEVVVFTATSISKTARLKTGINRRFFQPWKITNPLLPVLQVFVRDNLVPFQSMTAKVLQ